MPTDPLAELTPERWERARRVLAGEVPGRISWHAAAKEAGVSLSTLKRWVRRSEERHIGDEEWVWEIAEFCAQIDELQGGHAEDVMWRRAIEGWEEPVFYQGEEVGSKRKFDNKLLMRALEVRDQRYAPKVLSEHRQMDAHEIMARFLAGKRIANAEAERQKLALKDAAPMLTTTAEELPPLDVEETA